MFSCIFQRTAEIEKADELLLVKRKQFSNMTIAEREKVTNCAKCRKRGHWAKECPSEHKSQAALLTETDPETSQEYSEPDDLAFAEIILNTGKISIDLENDWVADTGATSHMANRLVWFKNFQAYPSPKKCQVGNGDEVKVLGEGQVEVMSKLPSDGVISITLSKVLYVPDLTTNLLSIGACASKGITAMFSQDDCKLRKGHQTIMVGSRINERLYKLNLESKRPKAMLISNNRKLSEWNRTLGHASRDRILQLTKSTGIGVMEDEINCPDCAIGKGRRAPHPSVDRGNTAIGDLVHVDLSGKINRASIDGYYYFLLCQDAASELTFVYFVATRDQVWRAIMQLTVDFEAEARTPIKCIQSNNGSEFVNERTSLILSRCGIKHTTTAPYTPARNGRVEREMRTIVSSARSMLLAKDADKRFWSEAVRAACYIKNRLPTKRSDATPHERLTGKKTFVGHILEWGTQVYVVRTWTYCSKFDARAKKGTIVGFTSRRNTYRVYVSELNKVLETSDIIIKRHKPTDVTKQDATREEEVTVTVPVNAPSPTDATRKYNATENLESQTNEQGTTQQTPA